MKAIMEVDIVEVELKYCERCGSLWLREQGTRDVYCEACAAKLAEFPSHRRKRGPHTERKRDSDIEGGCYDGLAFICGEGGNA